MTITKGLKQAYDVQDITYDCLMAIREQLKQVTRDSNGVMNAPNNQQAAMIAALSKAWRDAQEQIRIHRGKPLPGSLSHEKVKLTGKHKQLSKLTAMLEGRFEAQDAQDGVEPPAKQAQPPVDEPSAS